MSVAIDVILICIAAVIILHAAKKGFVASALSFAFSLLGTVLSWLAAGMLCEQVYDRFVKVRLLSVINDSIIPAMENRADAGIESVLSVIPQPILDLAQQLGIWDGSAMSHLSSVVDASQWESAFFGPLATFLVKCVLFAVFSVILGIILRLLAGFINRLVKRSFLRGVNSALGALFGLLESALLLFVLSLCLTAICIPAADTSFASAVAESKICGLAVEILHSL